MNEGLFSNEISGISNDNREKPSLLMTHKSINLAVSDDSNLARHEVRIIDQPEFQMLREISQLGSSSKAYPSANHTRFEHSLGTLNMSVRMINAIRQNTHSKVEERTISEEEEILVRLIALLHDIAHIPYGHTLEDEFSITTKHDEDQARFDFYLGRESNIGKVIIEDLGAEMYERFIKILTCPKKDLQKLGRDYFIYELVNNTVCADLLDYLRRDHFYCNLSLGLSYRFLKYIHLYTDPSGGLEGFETPTRVGLRIAKNGKKVRGDALDELVTLLEYRRKLGQNVYYHHAKISSGAMIAVAVQRAIKSGILEEQDLWMMGDNELVTTLSKSKSKEDPAIQQLAQDFRWRRLYKISHEITNADLKAEVITKNNRVREQYLRFHEDSEFRLQCENQICEWFELPQGSVIFYCPGFKMQRKRAEMNIYWQGHYLPLADCKGDEVMTQRLNVILNAHEALWSFKILLHPDYMEDEDLREKIEHALEYYLKDDTEKSVTKRHFNNILNRYYSSNATPLSKSEFDEKSKKVLDVVCASESHANRDLLSLVKLFEEG